MPSILGASSWYSPAPRAHVSVEPGVPDVAEVHPEPQREAGDGDRPEGRPCEARRGTAHTVTRR